MDLQNLVSELAESAIMNLHIQQPFIPANLGRSKCSSCSKRLEQARAKENGRHGCHAI
jgi:hypothetical protein